MLDAQNRTQISLETFPNNPFDKEKKIYFYYKDKNKLLISTEEISSEMYIGKANVDNKRRFVVPQNIINVFGTRNIIVGRQDSEYYLLFFPTEKD